MSAAAPLRNVPLYAPLEQTFVARIAAREWSPAGWCRFPRFKVPLDTELKQELYLHEQRAFLVSVARAEDELSAAKASANEAAVLEVVEGTAGGVQHARVGSAGIAVSCAGAGRCRPGAVGRQWTGL